MFYGHHFLIWESFLEVVNCGKLSPWNQHVELKLVMKYNVHSTFHLICSEIEYCMISDQAAWCCEYSQREWGTSSATGRERTLRERADGNNIPLEKPHLCVQSEWTSGRCQPGQGLFTNTRGKVPQKSLISSRINIFSRKLFVSTNLVVNLSVPSYSSFLRNRTFAKGVRPGVLVKALAASL